MAPAKNSTAKSAKAPATKEVAPAEPAPEIVAATAAPAEAAGAATPEDALATLTANFDAVTKVLGAVLNQVKDLQTQVRNLQKDSVKAVKTANAAAVAASKAKGGKKARRAPPADGKPRPPSGFAKPCALSAELCAFLNVPAGTEMSRTDVTKRVHAYIKEKNLQVPEDKRTIKPDATLQKLMNVGKDASLTYFNLQKCMKHHFVAKATA